MQKAPQKQDHGGFDSYNIYKQKKMDTYRVSSHNRNGRKVSILTAGAMGNTDVHS